MQGQGGDIVCVAMYGGQTAPEYSDCLLLSYDTVGRGGGTDNNDFTFPFKQLIREKKKVNSQTRPYFLLLI